MTDHARYRVIPSEQAVIELVEKLTALETRHRDEFENDETSLTASAFNEAVTRRRHALAAWEVKQA